MSHKTDRKRAESGWIFRDGHLVRKEDWYGTLDPKDTSAVLAEAEPYFCGKCNITHHRGKIHQEHRQFVVTEL